MKNAADYGWPDIFVILLFVTVIVAFVVADRYKNKKDLRWAELQKVRHLEKDWYYKPNKFSTEDYPYCQRCQCNKSGDIETPNSKTEACENPNCICHGE